MGSVLLLVKLSGKNRLSHRYTEEQRRRLVLFLFERMLKVLDGFDVYVASPDNLEGGGFKVIRDEWKDINKVITAARKIIRDDILILPCDLPFVGRDGIEELFNCGIKIVPSQNGGTNALFLPVDVDIVTQFGKNSFEKHVKVFESQGLHYEVIRSDRFRDIDTEEDIMWALEHGGECEFSQFVKEL
jgi:2-phospho-L-lactate guanylyltransferase